MNAFVPVPAQATVAETTVEEAMTAEVSPAEAMVTGATAAEATVAEVPVQAAVAMVEEPAAFIADTGVFAAPHGLFGEEPDTASSEEAGGPRGPRSLLVGGHEVPARLLVLLAVLVLVAGGGYFVLHSSSATPSNNPAPVHHAVPPAAAPAHHARRGGKQRSASKHHATTAPKHHAAGAGHLTLARELAYAGAVFGVLPAQFPGWQQQGAIRVHQSHSLTAGDRSQIRAVERCAGITVPPQQDAVAMSQSFATGRTGRFGLQGQGEIDFFRSAANATRNLDELSNAGFLQCAKSTSTLLPSHSGGTFSSFTLKPLHLTGLPGARGIEGDAILHTAGTTRPFRFIEIEARVGRQGIEYNAAGAGRVQTLGSDLRVLEAMLAKARSTRL